MRNHIFRQRANLHLLSFACLFLIISCLFCSMHLHSQTVLVSEYQNGPDPLGGPIANEWSELIVVQDNLDMRGMIFSDYNSTQDERQGGIRFKNIDYWRNIRAGTIIGIWHRGYNITNASLRLRDQDTTLADGRIMLAATDTRYFDRYTASTIRDTWDNAALNIAVQGDILEVLDFNEQHIHGLGHRNAPGSAWVGMAPPKLNTTTTLDNLWSNRALGTTLSQYNAASGTPLVTAASSASPTRTLPNQDPSSSATTELLWRELRRPRWSAPQVSATVNQNSIQLSWNSCLDPYPTDNYTGYIVIRDTANVTNQPINGQIYTPGQTLGSSVVVAVTSSSQTLNASDNTSLTCGALYTYRVYAYRFAIDDELQSAATVTSTRGRQYNLSSVATSVPITRTIPQTARLQSNTARTICEGVPISISATAVPNITPQWMRNNTDIPGATQWSLNVSQSGEYRIKLRDASGCLGFSDSILVTVNPSPRVTITNTTPIYLCGSTPTTLISSANGSGTLRYQWKRNTVLISGATNSTFEATTDGNYTVTVTDFADCSTTSQSIELRIRNITTTLSQQTTSSNPLSFGLLQSCESSKEQDITFTNTSTGEIVQLDILQQSPYFQIVSDISGNVNANGGTRLFKIRFTPGNIAIANDSIVLRINPCGTLITIYCTGNKDQSSVTLLSSNTALDFGIIPYCNGVTARRTIYFTYPNSATSTAQITQNLTRIVSATAGFNIAVPPNGNVLQPGQVDSVIIEFNPTITNIVRTTDIIIPYLSGVCSDEFRISLSGTAEIPILRIQEDTLAVPIIAACSALPYTDTVITLRNDSRIPISVSGISDASLSIIEPLPILIPEKSSRQVLVRFNPLTASAIVNNPNVACNMSNPCPNRQSSLFTLIGRRESLAFSLSQDSVTLSNPIVACSGSNISDTTITITLSANSTQPNLTVGIASVTTTSNITTNLVVGNIVGTSQTFTLTLKRGLLAVGSFTETLSLTTSPCNSTLNFTVRGVVTSEGVVFDTTGTISAQMDITTLAGTIATKQISVKNVGSTSIVIPALPAQVGLFEVVNVTPSVGQLLPSGASCVYTIEFRPPSGQSSITTEVIPITFSNQCTPQISLRVTGNAQVQNRPVKTFVLDIPDTLTGSPGQIIDIPITISSTKSLKNTPFQKMEIPLYYDVSALEIFSITPSPLLVGSTLSQQRVFNAQNECIGTQFSLNGAMMLIDSGVILTAKARVLLGKTIESNINIAYQSIGIDSQELVIDPSLILPSSLFILTGECTIRNRLVNFKSVDVQIIGNNPTSSSTSDIQISVVGQQQTTLTLYSLSGESVLSIYNGVLEEGTHSFPLSPSNLPQGIYALVLQNGNARRHVPVMIIK